MDMQRKKLMNILTASLICKECNILAASWIATKATNEYRLMDIQSKPLLNIIRLQLTCKRVPHAVYIE